MISFLVTGVNTKRDRKKSRQKGAHVEPKSSRGRL